MRNRWEKPDLGELPETRTFSKYHASEGVHLHILSSDSFSQSKGLLSRDRAWHP